MKRRTFLGLLAALPFARNLAEEKTTTELPYIFGVVRGTGNNSVLISRGTSICDDYQEIDPELYQEIIRGFARV